MSESFISRRDFMKSFPRELVNSIQSLAGRNADDSLKKDTLFAGSEISEDKPQIAVFDVNRCLAWGGADCQWCYLVCPLRDQAMFIQDLKPVIYPAFCNGCAKCVTACRTVNDLPAIHMVAV